MSGIATSRSRIWRRRPVGDAAALARVSDESPASSEVSRSGTSRCHNDRSTAIGAPSAVDRQGRHGRALKGVAMDEADERGRGNDLQVEPQRPVLDVIEVHLDAQAHLFGVIGRPA